MISFPATTFQASLIEKTIKRRPRNSADDSYGRAASAITPRLYLSDLVTACSSGTLERLGITHIVSAIEPDFRADFGENVSILHIPIRDEVNTNITEWFDTVVKFIKDALDTDENHKVLVHCFQGISRSPTLVCAYLVATTPMGPREAIAYVQAKRGIVAPNFGFRRQLIVWGSQFGDAKAKSEEERRKKVTGVTVLGDAFSRWMGITKSLKEAKTRAASPQVPGGVDRMLESASPLQAQVQVDADAK